MTSRKVLIGMALSGCALLAIASPAAAQKPRAKAKVSQETLSFVLPPNATNLGIAQAGAPCPSNRTLIGGGSRFVPGTLITLNIELISSGPGLVGTNAWDSVFDNNTNVAQTALSDALCLKKKLNVKGGEGGKVKPKVQQVTQPLILPGQATNDGRAEVDVPCPEGYTVVGGGGRFVSGPAPGAVVLFESGLQNDAANAWHVRYDNDAAVAQTTEASAMCLKNKAKVKKGEDGKARSRVEYVRQTVTLPPQGTNLGVAEFDVVCPENTLVVGGGARFAQGAPLTTDIELFESGPNGSNGWHARYNNNHVVAQSVEVSASCLKRKLRVK